MSEEPLAGGNATTGVVRFGATVRKPWTGSSSAVQELLARLVAEGIDVLQPLGRDEYGRQVFDYVKGTPAIDLPELSLPDLARVGSMIRAIHDICAELGPSFADAWAFEMLISAEHPDLLCHNDLGAWNLITGDRWVFID